VTAYLTFFPVGNGDMVLLKTENGKTMLIDMNIRSPNNDSSGKILDVATRLREKLPTDSEGRRYVDALLISHPDEDHCRGLGEHFHLGPPNQCTKNGKKILIREIWWSPAAYRRAFSLKNVLCDDAMAFYEEARRRVGKYRATPQHVVSGDRILMLGEDENGKANDSQEILIRVGEVIKKIDGQVDCSLHARLLAPLPSEDEEDEDALSKNSSSTIIQFSLTGNKQPDKCRFLTGGDAEVAVWERLWSLHQQDPDRLSYDILHAPHHCSWHSLSHDSWGDPNVHATVSSKALKALSQARDGATIVASSDPIRDDNNDPPCIGAKREYKKIVNGVSGSFDCTGEHPSEQRPDLLEFEIGGHGPRPLRRTLMGGPAILGAGAIGRQSVPHG